MTALFNWDKVKRGATRHEDFQGRPCYLYCSAKEFDDAAGDDKEKRYHWTRAKQEALAEGWQVVTHDGFLYLLGPQETKP